MESFLAAVHVTETETDTRALKQALASPEADNWRASTESEMAEVRAREKWTLVRKPEGVKCPPSTAILTVKIHVDGTIDKCKACLMQLDVSNIRIRLIETMRLSLITQLSTLLWCLFL